MHPNHYVYETERQKSFKVIAVNIKLQISNSNKHIIKYKTPQLFHAMNGFQPRRICSLLTKSNIFSKMREHCSK